MSNKFSDAFIERYKYCALTNKVLKMLESGMNEFSVLELVLKHHEDFVRGEMEAAIIRNAIGTPPQYIIATKEFIDKAKLDQDLIKNMAFESIESGEKESPNDPYSALLIATELFKGKQREIKPNTP